MSTSEQSESSIKSLISRLQIEANKYVESQQPLKLLASSQRSSIPSQIDSQLSDWSSRRSQDSSIDITLSKVEELSIIPSKFIDPQSSHSAERIREKTRHPNQLDPQLIDWMKRSKCSLSDMQIPVPQNVPIVPLHSQESIIVKDLLLCFQGFSGHYIVRNDISKDGKPTFTINDKLDACLIQLALSLLPAAVYHSVLTYFIEEQRKFKYGKVNHALSSAFGKLQVDYIHIIEEMEYESMCYNLGLHELYSQIQPYLYSFETVVKICESIRNSDAKGGKTLTLLHEFTLNSTGKEEKLCQFLLESAAVPYMKQLQDWLYKGIIIDPYNEFLIEDNQIVLDKDQLPDEYSDSYWGKCYTINKEKIPVFLEKTAPYILSTGKYLNVLRQYKLNIKSTKEQNLEYSWTEDNYTVAIMDAYEFASASLLNHLMHDNDLIGHLKSVKHYFLFDLGDFFMKFMDMSEMELNKDIDDVVPSRLQTLVELAARTSSASADPYKDNIKTDLHQDDIMTLLLKIISQSGSSSKPQRITKGWESMTFTYDVKWPISLVLNKSSQMIYQLIFRHLFFCKYVERLLCKVWIDNKESKKLPPEVSNEYKPAWDLRQRMLLYVHNLEYYMMVEVIEPNWNLFIEKLQHVKNLDEVLECHNSFQTTCLVKCMLTSPQHFKVLNTFLRKCVEFCLFIESCNEFKTSPTHAPNGVTVDFDETESFAQKISNFNKAFTQHFNYLFKTTGKVGVASDINDTKIIEMLNRLDFNSYYKRSVKEKKGGSAACSVASSEVSG
ncbi:UNVERIFIED_CONTAM: hypothetical protein PYX00_004383 [Menopon gallinae]|uniref:Gamma-tubulin complex component n=1 Tax=Menopon gallinae TaxID=328185 RepID=A0AAW2I5F0_9NEOP